MYSVLSTKVVNKAYSASQPYSGTTPVRSPKFNQLIYLKYKTRKTQPENSLSPSLSLLHFLPFLSPFFFPLRDPPHPDSTPGQRRKPTRSPGSIYAPPARTALPRFCHSNNIPSWGCLI